MTSNAYADASNGNTITVDLSWDTNAVVEEYQAQVRGNGSNTTASATSGTTSTIINLLPETTYQWRVRTKCNGAWASWPSWQETFDTPTGEACESTGLASNTYLDASNGNSISVNLSWDANAVVEEYQAQIRGNGVNTTSTATTVTSTTVGNLLPETTYQWRVRTKCNGAWASWPSWQETFVTPSRARAFVTTWKTDNNGTSSDLQITVPTTGSGYNYRVSWEEVGNVSNNGEVGPFTGDAIIDFPNAGIYQVSISGDFPRIYFNNTADEEKILTVEQWGDQVWTSMSRAFMGCNNLTFTATDAPDLSQVTDMSNMFRAASSFNSDIGAWDVSNVQNMSEMFRSASVFNQDISAWDVSNVTSMYFMFGSARDFNQNIGAWDVNSVVAMNFMFSLAESFNQDISSWDVGEVLNMRWMFGGASSFNQNIGLWDVSSVTNMNTMLSGASSFDQSLGAWDISNVTDMGNMLSNSGVGISNYETTLLGWATLDPGESQIPSGITLEAPAISYCDETGRAILIDTYGWTITDGGVGADCSIPLVTTWKTDNAGSSSDTQIIIPTTGSGYNYHVTWEEVGNTSNNGTTGPFTGDATIDFPAAGTYLVSITGDFPRIYFEESFGVFRDKLKIVSINQWGNNPWQSMNRAFVGCENLTILATDNPDLSNVTDMGNMFQDASSMNADLSGWDVSNVTNLSEMFLGATVFDQDLSSWNVSNVTDMSGLFQATSFNRDISNWDVSNVRDLDRMFSSTPFNHAIGSWDVSSARQMFSMFSGTPFNQDISGWDVSNVRSMDNMFFDAPSFNQDLSNWDVSLVEGTVAMFRNATSFNQDISSWSVSNVQNMGSMFEGASSFDQNLGPWDISSVVQGGFGNTGMLNMFDNSGVSLENYDATLAGWATLDAGEIQIPVNISLGAAGLRYCDGGSARDELMSTFGWTISDDIEDCPLPPVYYWVGGTGNWSDVSHWATSSGGDEFQDIPPTSDDSVYFDENSFTSLGQTVTVDVTANCSKLDMSEVTNDPILNVTRSMTIREGDMVLSPNLTVVNTSRITLESTEAGNTFVTHGLDVGEIAFSGSGSWSLSSPLLCDELLLLNGATLETNGNRVEMDQLIASGNPDFNLSTSEVIVRTGRWDNGVTVDGGLSTIRLGFEGSSSRQRLFEGGNNNFGIIETEEGSEFLYIRGGAYGKLIANSNISLTTITTDSLLLKKGITCSLSGGTHTVNNYLQADSVLLRGPSSVPAILSMPAGIANYFTDIQLENINATGGATFTAAPGSIDFGGNTGWVFEDPLPSVYYWVGGTGNWSDVSHWATSSGGDGFQDIPPTSDDSVYFDENSFTSLGQTVTVDVTANCSKLDMSEVTNDPILNVTRSMTIREGDMVLSPNLTVVNTSRITLESTEAGNTFVTHGLDVGEIAFSGSGSWSLSSPLLCDELLLLNGATLETNGNRVEMDQLIASGNPDFNLSTSEVIVRTGRWDNGVTVDGGLSTIRLGFEGSSSRQRLFEGGNNNFGIIETEEGSEFLYIRGGAYGKLIANSNISLTTITTDSLLLKKGITCSLSGGTHTVNNYLQADSVLLRGPSSVPAILSMPAGIANYFTDIQLENINATGGATFTAAPGSTDLGGNTGWVFEVPLPSVYYWVGGTGNWSDMSHWATSSGGDEFQDIPPTSDDSVYFDENSFTSLGQTVTVDVTANCSKLDMSEVTNDPILNVTRSMTIREGDMVLSPNLTVVNTSRITLESTEAGNTFVTHGLDVGEIAFSGSGSWSLSSPLLCDELLLLNGATLETNGNRVEMDQLIASGNPDFNLSTSEVIVRTGRWDNGVTVDGGLSTIRLGFEGSSSRQRLFEGGNNNFGIIETEEGSEFLYIRGGAYGKLIANSNISLTTITTDSLLLKKGITCSLSGGTHTVNNYLQADSVLLRGPSSVPAILSMPAGIDNCFTDIQLENINASGGATFTAGPGSTDFGGNTGWVFSAIPCNPVSSRMADDSETLLSSGLESLIGELNIYPNPANNVVLIQGINLVKSRIFIYDLHGKLVYQSKELTQLDVQVDVSSLKSGLFQLIVEKGHARRIEKLVIRH